MKASLLPFRLPVALTFAISVVTTTGPEARTAESPARERPAPIELARQLNKAFIDVAETVSPAVVVVSVAHSPDSLEFNFGEGHPFLEQLPPDIRRRFEERRRRRSREQSEDAEKPEKPEKPAKPREPVFDGQGSGVAIRKEGYIVTNRHVVEGAEKIRVRFQDGSEFDAIVRGTDEQSDLAVLKIEPGAKSIPIARFGDSSTVRVGEFAIAIGAPLELDYSVTFGHISAKGRSRILDDPSMDQDFLQTDANINPGNSGGPLVNIDGEVVGINTLIRGLHTGIGFAIPANLVREVTDQLIATGRFVRAYLGVRIRGLRESSEYRETIPGVTDGVVVFAIPPDGPAAKSDLKPGDVITAVDGRNVASPQELKNEIRSKEIGAAVALTVHRFGKDIQVAIRPEAWPEPAEVHTLLSKKEEPPTAPAADEAKPSTLGLTVQAINRELAEKFNVERSSGVVVTEVEKDSLAERTGLRPGDVIREINHKAVQTVKQFNETIKKADPGKGVLILFTSKGTSRFEILKQRK